MGRLHGFSCREMVGIFSKCCNIKRFFAHLKISLDRFEKIKEDHF